MSIIYIYRLCVNGYSAVCEMQGMGDLKKKKKSSGGDGCLLQCWIIITCRFVIAPPFAFFITRNAFFMFVGPVVVSDFSRSC